MDKVVEYRKKYNYITNRAHTYQTNINPPKDILTEYVKLYTSGVLWLASGYAWNGADVATDTETNMRASLIHDALVCLIQDDLLDKGFKSEVDWEYYRTCREDGMSLPRAIMHLWGVQYNKWESHNYRKVYVSPRGRTNNGMS